MTVQGYEYKDIFYEYSHARCKFIERYGIKWTCGKYDYYFVKEFSNCWIAYEGFSGSSVGGCKCLDTLKKIIKENSKDPKFLERFSKSIEAEVKSTGISPLYWQISLFEEIK